MAAMMSYSVLLSLFISSLNGVIFEHCYKITFVQDKNSSGKEQSSASIFFQLIPHVLIPYNKKTTVNPKLVSRLQLNIARESLNCILFYLLNLDLSKAKAVHFLEDFDPILVCDGMNGTSIGILPCLLRETYIVELHTVPSLRQQMSNGIYYFSVPFFQLAEREDGGIDFCITTQKPCSIARKWEAVKDWNSLDVDLEYMRAIESQCYIPWVTYTKGGEFKINYLRDRTYHAKAILSATDRLNLQILHAIVRDFNSSITPQASTRISTTIIIYVYIEQTLRTYESEDVPSSYWIVVDEFAYNFLSCAHTELQPPYQRYLGVFNILLWLLTMLLLIGMALLIQIYVSMTTNILSPFMVIVPIILEQSVEVPKKIAKFHGIKIFFITAVIFSLLLTNTYRGKLAMEFTAPPIRNKIATIDEGISHGLRIFVHVEQECRDAIKEQFMKQSTMTWVDKLKVVDKAYGFGSRFYAHLRTILNADTSNFTKLKYETMKKRLRMPEMTTESNETKYGPADQELLKCNNTFLVDDSRIVEFLFEKLQSEKLNPGLYLGNDKTYTAPRVWILVRMNWDRNSVVFKRAQSLLHSGIFKFHTKNGKWDLEKKIRGLMVNLNEMDRKMDEKFMHVFFGFLILIALCMSCFLWEILVNCWQWAKIYPKGRLASFCQLPKVKRGKSIKIEVWPVAEP